MSNERRADLDGDIDHLSGRDIDALVFLLAGASPNLAKKLAGKNGEGERGHLVSDLQGAATQFFITQTQHERSKKAQIRRELKKLLKSASRLEERLINIEPGPMGLALPARVSDLRVSRYEIETRREDVDGSRIGRYVLLSTTMVK